MAKSKIKVKSEVKIIIRDIEGNVKEQVTLKNLITDLLFNLYRDALAGDITADDFEIKYLGIGNDDTPPIPADTILGNETFRKILTSSSKPGTGQYKTEFYIAPEEAIGLIEEVGWFAGPLASSSPNTGTLIARVLYHKNKTALESLQCERIDRIEVKY